MFPSVRSLWLWIIAAFFVVAGANHFAHPAPYRSMMPSYLPWPDGLIWISGIAEMLGGLGLLLPQTRRLAAWGLIALLVAVFHANVNVALHGWPGVDLAPWILWLRLPFQPLFAWWIYRAGIHQPGRSRYGAGRQG
jgi:uncharacterized membrane protein